MKNNLTITTATVSINVIQVDGKRMTKAVFDQIDQVGLIDYINNITNTNNTQILGYVSFNKMIKEKWIIWVTNGLLKKTQCDLLYESIFHCEWTPSTWDIIIKSCRYDIGEIEKRYLNEVEHINVDTWDIPAVFKLNKTEKKKVKKTANKLLNFYAEIDLNQLYISI